MCNVPINCSVCPYENECNTCYKAKDCHFYSGEYEVEKIFLVERFRRLINKIFR